MRLSRRIAIVLGVFAITASLGNAAEVGADLARNYDSRQDRECVFWAVPSCSDLLVIKAQRHEDGRLKAKVDLRPDAGHGVEAYDLLGNAEVSEFFELPLFDEAQYPGAPSVNRWVYEPVALSSRDEFFGVIGWFQTVPFTEEEFRNEIFFNYEIEVDGVAIPGRSLQVEGPVPCPFPGLEDFFCAGYQVTQRITTPGEHRVVYRSIQRKDIFDGGELYPAVLYEDVFTVIIEQADGHDDDGDDDDDDEGEAD